MGTFEVSLRPRFLTSSHGFDLFSFVITDSHKDVIEVFNLRATLLRKIRSLELIEHIQIAVTVVIDGYLGCRLRFQRLRVLFEESIGYRVAPDRVCSRQILGN